MQERTGEGPLGSAARYESWARSTVYAAEVPGMAVGAAKDGVMTYFAGFGERDREAHLPITPDTVFGIGSVTKSFTAAAILTLQEAGRLTVDDPVTRYLPELRIPNAAGRHPMRIHHLLTHTSGLPPLVTLMPSMLASLRSDPGAAADMGLPEDAVRDMEPIESMEGLLAFLNGLDIRPLGTPGEVFSYSNDGFALLGTIIERVSGETYEDYVRHHILEPAGMSRTTIDLGRLGEDPNITTIYARRQGKGGDDRTEEEKAADGEVIRSPLWWESPAMAAAGFIRSTTSDLLRYLEIFRTGGLSGPRRILSAESVQAMTACHAACSVGTYYGYGLMITPDHQGVTLIEHGGAVKGVAAEILLVPELGRTVAVLSNLAGAPSAKLSTGFVDAELGLDPQTTFKVAFPAYEPAALADPANLERVRALAGRYASDEGATVEIEVSEEGELALVSDGTRLPARRIGERRFAIPFRGDEMSMEFLTVGGEEAVTFGFRVLRRAPVEDAVPAVPA